MLKKKKFLLLTLLVFILVAVFGFGSMAVAGELKTVTIEYGGYNRSYDYYVPPGYDGSTSSGMSG